MVKVAATFDGKAARPLPKEKADALKLGRFFGGGMLLAGGGLIYLANHQYYHLTGTPSYILRTYNQTLWASRVVTGSGAILFGRNQFWLSDSNRKSWGAKPFFHSLESKSYKEIKAAVDANEWDFLNNDDIWALLKPSFDKQGCTKFWTEDKEGAIAFKEQIKKLVLTAAEQPTILLGDNGFYAKHGELPLCNNWISQEDGERFGKEVIEAVEQMGPAAFIEKYGDERLSSISDGGGVRKDAEGLCRKSLSH